MMKFVICLSVTKHGSAVSYELNLLHERSKETIIKRRRGALQRNSTYNVALGLVLLTVLPLLHYLMLAVKRTTFVAYYAFLKSIAY